MLKNKEKYDAVTAPVPGVDQGYRNQLIKEYYSAGDPDPHADSEKPIKPQKTKKTRLKIFK